MDLEFLMLSAHETGAGISRGALVLLHVGCCSGRADVRPHARVLTESEVKVTYLISARRASVVLGQG